MSDKTKALVAYCTCGERLTVVRTAHANDYSKRLKVCGKCNRSLNTFEVQEAWYEQALELFKARDIATAAQSTHEPAPIPKSAVTSDFDANLDVMMERLKNKTSEPAPVITSEGNDAELDADELFERMAGVPDGETVL